MDVPATVECAITTTYRHREYNIQLPLPGANCRHKVHELKKHAVLMLYPESNMYNDFSGLHFVRVVMLAVGSHILHNNASLVCFDCHDRMMRPGGACLLGLKLANGDYYLEGNYRGEDDEGSLPSPL